LRHKRALKALLGKAAESHGLYGTESAQQYTG
jgi:hypothetical protein